MSKKYIDLHGDVCGDIEIGKQIDEQRVSVFDILQWLDEFASEHPDQVPGRTITESEFHEVADAHRNGVLGWEDLAGRFGITVVPDPAPSNFERLEDLVDQWRKGPGHKVLTQYLDEAGVKAPGGDDEQR